jgi:signal transduction histidine kinase
MAARERNDNGTPFAAPERALSALRTKYVEVCQKYASLVRRLERRVESEVGAYRLAVLGFRASAMGMALVRDGKISVANSRWVDLATAQGGWEPANGPPGNSARGSELRTLVRRFSEELIRAPRPTVMIRQLRESEGERVIELRLERASDSPRTVLVLASDVTDRVRSELEMSRLREALFQKEHLRVVGEVATAMAHELGNTLRALSARVTLLSSDLLVGEGKASVLHALEETVEAALGTVRRLHDLARSGRLDPVPVRLQSILDQAVAVMAFRAGPEGAELKIDAALHELPPVLGTVAELSHVFLTLLSNARDAMPGGGEVEIRGERRGESVLVTLRDHGPGIAIEHLPQLFEPFFTTKGTAGTGVGLWLAANSIRRVGGKLGARNAPGGGAEFYMELPVANAQLTDRPELPRAGREARRR